MMSSYKRQENRALKSHDCVLIYESETEGNENHTSNSLITLTTKMLKVKKLEEISSCYSSNQLEKMTFFQCMEEVEKVKCFLEGNSNEQDSRSEENGDMFMGRIENMESANTLKKAEEKVWPNPALKERTPIEGKRKSSLTERSTEKNQFSYENEKVNRLNKKNAEKTNAPVAQRSIMCSVEKQDNAEELVSRNSIESDGKDSSHAEDPKRQENSITGDDKQGIVRENECLVFKGEKSELPSKEDTSGREAEEGEGNTTANELVLDQCSNKRQHVDKTNGDECHERYINTLKDILTQEILENSGSTFQNMEQTEFAGSSKRRVVECFVNEDNKKSRIDVVCANEEQTFQRTEDTRQDQRSCQGQPQELAGRKTSREEDLMALLDDLPAPAAPFDHRIVTAKYTAVDSSYTVSKTEILGGGRFGQVHKCEEKATGLKLAAKIIKTRCRKDKEEVKNEISIMNQLDHVNLIQLYDAFESKNDIILVMEYVEGGELFDRIIDENYNLTELDTILFIKQICEGIRHMHQMYILHLDLKPENILCVNQDAKQIKIIDFGLARRYKPREKLKVNFGTPEFLSPEVVNYDFVSFSTDMWSVGVITYMLLSGLSPFLGDNDAETLSNVLACRWDLEEEEFQDISDEARDFISKLLIKEKSWRISASEALKHSWLSDHKLHSRLSTKKKNCNSDAQNLVTK
ncbi:myosin light chain kinase family member 4 isoform X1 [Perognathus longimembris pacificus]|uniref:myosin light chain kinase family member 4 isoform X1 n=1 Tax=Perognathus longimembris pacificus TaxID=214514 RepID=UPI002019FB5E|nr:myosin light chain kinase family member 4 isoform X1 [Perognathus longimembris pacificus]